MGLVEPHHIRVAVIQLEFHPAANVDRRSPLEDPLFDWKHDSLTPVSGDVPEHLTDRWRALRGRIRHAYVEQLLLRLRTILATLQSWQTQIVVFPEYSIPCEALEPLAEAAGELVVVAGTHLVDQPSRRSGVYQRLGWPEPPQVGQSVAPVLYQRRLLALQPKLNPAVAEASWLSPGKAWQPVPLAEHLPGPMGVLICLDYLFREGSPYQSLVAPALADCRFLAVPALTPHYSHLEFSGHALEDSRRYARSVLFANAAAGGHSSIYVDQGAPANQKTFPLAVGELEPGDEGAIVADLDFTLEAPGPSTRYQSRPTVKPFAAASFVYRTQQTENRYADFLDSLTASVGASLSLEDWIERVRKERELLLIAGAMEGAATRNRRLRRLLLELDQLLGIADGTSFLREMIFPAGVLPLDATRAALAKGASDVVFAWQRERRGEGMAEIERQLREKGQLPGGKEIWTADGQAAFEQLATTVLEPPPEPKADSPSPVPVEKPAQLPDGVHPATFGLQRLGSRPKWVFAFGKDWRAVADVDGDVVERLLPPTDDFNSERLPFSKRHPPSIHFHFPPLHHDEWMSVPRTLDNSPDSEFLRQLAIAQGGDRVTAVAFRKESDRMSIPCVLFHSAAGQGWTLWGQADHADELKKAVKAVRGLLGKPVAVVAWTPEERSAAIARLLPERFSAARDTARSFRDDRLREVGGVFIEPRVRVAAGEPQEALQALDDWLDGPKPKRTALVLGEFGTGKSTTLAEWSLRRWDRAAATPSPPPKSTAKKPTAKKSTKRQEQPLAAPSSPLPLFVNLAGAGVHSDAEQLLLAAASTPDSDANRAALRLLIQTDRLLPVFDGFDEMATKVTPQEMAGKLSELLAVAKAGGRIVLSSRSHYFPTEQHLQGAISQALSQALGSESTYQRIDFQLFDQQQVELMTRRVIHDRQDAKKAVDRITEFYPLKDLVQRPLFLGIVLNTLDQFEPGARITKADLFEAYLHRWLEQSHQHPQPVYTDEQKIILAESLAEQLWRSGEPSCALGELQATVRQALVSQPVAEDVSVGAAYLAACGGAFFVREGDDRFRFAHKSFLEFFLAKSLLKTLAERPAVALQTKPITPEVAAFLGELLRREGRPQESPQIKQLHAWLRESRATSTVDEAHATAAANGLRLLLELSRWSRQRDDWFPIGMALRGINMVGENLAGASCLRADLRDAQLSGCDLSDANLSGSDLTGGRFVGTKFNRANLEGVNAERGCFLLAEGDHTNWDGASLERANLSQSTWTHCHAHAARFTGTELTAAILCACDGFPERRTATLDASPFPGREIGLVTGHRENANAVAFSPDGFVLATGGDDGTIRLWDVATGNEIRQLAGHTASVTSVAFSPDGAQLASGSSDNTLRLWDVAAGNVTRQLNAHTNTVESIAFSSDGELLASGSSDNKIRLWDVETGNEVRQLVGHTSSLTSVAFSPDAVWLASASRDATLRLWDVATGNEIRQLTAHSQRVMSVAFSPDGARLASGSNENSIRIWDVATGNEIRQLVGHINSVSSVTFSSDGLRIASGSHDSTIRVWDVATGHQVRQLVGHTNRVNIATFSPDGALLASASADKTVRLWDVASGNELRQLARNTNKVTSVSFSPDGAWLASSSVDNTIRLWDVETGNKARQFTGHTGPVTCLVFHPDASQLASGSFDNTLRLWDVATGTEVGHVTGHTHSVRCVAFSPDGARLVCDCDDDTLRLWDVAKGKEIRQFIGHTSWIESVTFSPNGAWLASGSSDDTIRLWDVATGNDIRQLNAHIESVTSVAFSPDGERLASGSDDRTLRLWDVDTGSEIRQHYGHTAGVTSVAFSPNGARLASGSRDTTLRLWDMATGNEIRQLTSDSEWVTSLSFSPDGARIASGSADHTLRLWHVETGTEIARWEMAPDGSAVIVASGHYRLYQEPKSPRFWRSPSQIHKGVLYAPLGIFAEVLHNPARVEQALAGTLPEDALQSDLAARGLTWPAPWDGQRWIEGEEEAPASVPEATTTTIAIVPAVEPPHIAPTATTIESTVIAPGPGPGSFRPAGRPTDEYPLVGRDAALARLRTSVHEKISQRLCAPRRAGKTWLLAALKQQLEQDGYRVLHKSLQGGLDIRTPDDLARFLDPDIRRRSGVAKRFAEQLAKDGQKTVLLLDEIACLKLADPGLFGWLRGIGQEAAPIVYSGTQWDWVEVLKRAYEVPGSSFGNDVRPVELGEIDASVARRFLIDTSRNSGQEMPDTTAQWILERVGAWPFYLQAMGFAFVQASSAGNYRAKADREGVEDLYESEVLAASNDVFQGRWDDLPPPAQALVIRLLDDAHGGRIEIGELNYQERKWLLDVGLTSPLRGWIEDKPFRDWIQRNMVSMGGGKTKS